MDSRQRVSCNPGYYCRGSQCKGSVTNQYSKTLTTIQPNPASSKKMSVQKDSPSDIPDPADC